MLFFTRYRVKDDVDRDDVRGLLKAFAEKGVSPGTLYHWVAVSGREGFVVQEEADMKKAYEFILAYTDWLDFEIEPILTMEDALPSLLEFAGV